MLTYSLKVANIRKETDDTITICFKQPAFRKIRYKAGQYLTLMLRINGRRYIRPYSFSSSPILDSLLEVTIKRVLNGVVSNHLHDQVRIGDIIEAMEPMGDFVYEPSDSKNAMYFWGVGSGITPLISLIKEVLFLNPLTQVNLIYGNRNSESTIFFDQINFLLNKYSDRFNVWHFHTQLTIRDENPYIIEGRINKEFALNVLKGINGYNTVHYICGPAGLKESVIEALGISNVIPENIFTEDFELVRDPKDFNEIQTQRIKLSYQTFEYNLEIIKGKSILESALEAGLELPYSCQTGNCSTCKAKCITGEIKMIGLTKPRTDLQKGEYLLCCSHPLTENVNIQI